MVKLIFPCDFIGITQGYKSSHKAIDLGWSEKHGGPNHKIYAPYAGTVTYVKKNVKTRDRSSITYGNYIKIKHGNGLVTLVAHLKYNTIKVKVGDKVKKGQLLALMGDTGYSTGVHCHYEVILNGEKVNPLKYTYYTSSHVITSKTKKTYKPMKLESEVKKVNTVVGDVVNTSDKKEESKVIETSDNTEENSIENESPEVDDVIFEYTCSKTGMYKIHLNINEKLVIKD